MPFVVELIRELEGVPVADWLEELDVPDDLLRVPHEQRPLLAIPEAGLGEPPAKDWLGEHAEREVGATAADVLMRRDERWEIGLADRTQLDAFPDQHGRPVYGYPHRP
jgi:hypothetical protein